MKYFDAYITQIDDEIEISELLSDKWEQAGGEHVSTAWSGVETDPNRHFAFNLLWSKEHLYVRFNAKTDGDIVCSDLPDIDKKCIGLWDRDVCEIFIAPDAGEPRRYYEFEVAPTGEWLDVAIDLTSGERLSDWEYTSEMQTASRIEPAHIIMAIKIPFDAFGKRPERGDVWLGNVFRCVGTDPGRGYLAWCPTLSEKPNFHVPERFGRLHFV